MNKKIKIGIDYHGVITANPIFFKKFNAYALEHGCVIYVISGGYRADIESYLQLHDIKYSDIWSMVEHFDNLGKITYYNDGSFHVDNDLWDKAKAQYCAENKIDFHIDDSLIYGKYFTTNFCLYSAVNNNCIIKDVCIDFSLSIDKIFDAILNVIDSN